MIERIPRIARAELATRFMRPGVPVILTRQMEGWGALGWTPEVLRQRVGSVVLPVQEGNMEQEPTVLGAACLRDYLDEILRPDERQRALGLQAGQRHRIGLLDAIASQRGGHNRVCGILGDARIGTTAPKSERTQRTQKASFHGRQCKSASLGPRQVFFRT